MLNSQGWESFQLNQLKFRRDGAKSLLYVEDNVGFTISINYLLF